MSETPIQHNLIEEIERYPYFMSPVIEICRALGPDSDIGRLMRIRLEMNIGKETFRRLFPDNENHREKIEMHPENILTSDDRIDSFLDKFGKGKYAPGAYMPEEPSRPEPSVSRGNIEDISEKADLNKPLKKEKEIFRRIGELIKNQKYREALEIIELENLNNREKNVYFADQIRFLKKLIIIESHKHPAQG